MLLQKIDELKMTKKRYFFITAAFFFCVAFYCLIRIVLPCRVYQYEGSYAFSPDTPWGDTVIYDGISLRPGVYRIELAYDADTDYVGLCNVADGTVFAGGLCSNGEHLYRGLDETGYVIWLYEETDDLQVVISYDGKGSLATGNLRIVETNQLWTMLLACVIAVGAAVCAAMIFYAYDRAFSVSADKKHVFFWITTIALAVSLPYLCGYNIAGADLTYHLQRIEGVKDGLAAGYFPVRLEPKWLYGYGYANGIFYSNTLLYFPALLRLLGFPVSAAYNVYCIALNFATAWISYYCFSRIFGNRNTGILCSALYTLSIFRIYKLIITSAVGEGTAVTFIPLVLYGLYRIFTEQDTGAITSKRSAGGDLAERSLAKRRGRGDRAAWVPLMIGLSGLIQSHMLTCEITGAVIILYCLVYVRRILNGKVFMALCKAALSTLLVNLWFIVPFLDYYVTQDVHIKHVSARTIQDRGLYFAHLAFHFWSRGINTPTGDNGMQYSHPVGIGMVLIAALGVFLILWFSGAFRKLKSREVCFVKVTAGVGVLLLLMSTYIFPWDRIQDLHPILASLVSSLQFPNRFLGWGTVCLVLIFGFCMQYLMYGGIRQESGLAEPASAISSRNEAGQQDGGAGRDRTGRKTGAFLLAAAAVIGVTTSSMYLLDFVNSGEDYFVLYNEESMGSGYISGAEYLIEGTEEGKLTYADAVAGEGVELSACERKSLYAVMECVNKTSGEGYVDLPLLLYKGYRAVCTDTGQALEVCAGENNVVRVLLPEGFAGTVEVRFVSPVYWRISELASVLAVAGILIMQLKYRRKNRWIPAC